MGANGSHASNRPNIAAEDEDVSRSCDRSGTTHESVDELHPRVGPCATAEVATTAQDTSGTFRLILPFRSEPRWRHETMDGGCCWRHRVAEGS